MRKINIPKFKGSLNDRDKELIDEIFNDKKLLKNFLTIAKAVFEDMYLKTDGEGQIESMLNGLTFCYFEGLKDGMKRKLS